MVMVMVMVMVMFVTPTCASCVRPRPYLYTLVTDIVSGQDVVDSVNTTVGVSE